VPLVVEVEVGFDRSKDRQQLAITPQIVPRSHPIIEVRRHPPQEHLAVNGAASSGDLSARQLPRLLGVAEAGGKVPEVAARDDVAFCMAEPKLVGKLIRKVVRSRLYE
jgi:hypothetical protein